MHAGALFLVCPMIFAAALWTGVRAWVSPVPSVPDRVQALVGSCVVIPCSFTPHPLKGRKETVNVRLWFRGGGHYFPLRSIALNSEYRNQVSRDFQGRTSLFGRIVDGDCSVKIERISQDDSRVFEIALKRGDDFLWGKPVNFNLDVVDASEAPVISGSLSATEGQMVTVNCSVGFHCPTRPPALQWVWERGVQVNVTEHREVQVLHSGPHRLMLLGSLSFTVSHKVKPRLRCEVSYPGAKALAASKDLHVTFSPKDVKVQVQSLLVQEGGSALLFCSCKADPPAFEYHWSYSRRGHVVQLHQRTHAVRLSNVTRDMRVRCSARNLLGRGESRSTPLDIQFKPTILPLSSTCVVEESELRCRCSVDSNPKPAVTWSVNGMVPPGDFNVSLSSEAEELTATLRGRMEQPQEVVCFAVNALGNDSLVLLWKEEETAAWLWLLIPALAVCLPVFLLSLFFCYCCRRRAGKPVLSRCPDAYAEVHGISQDPMPVYINCTEVTHIYTNGSYQLVYQNCTPFFVHTEQIRPMGRRGGERRRGGEAEGMNRQAEVRGTREVQSAAAGDAETAIYVEII